MHKNRMNKPAANVDPDDPPRSPFVIRPALARRIEITPADWAHQLRSPFWRLYRMDAKGATLRWSGKSLGLAVGEVYLVPAWVAFSTETTRRMGHEYMHFYLNGLPLGWMREAFAAPLRIPASPAIQALAEAWSNALQQPAAWTAYGWGLSLAQAAVVSALESLPAEQSRGLQNWLLTAEEVRPATERIKNAFHQPPSNAELAAICGVGVDQFVRRFKAATGMTPTQYRLERCVQEAARQLAETSGKLEEIAEATGFVDRFYLSRVFKARLGVTPAAYRRAHRRERQ
jgi:AraC-like DNA-binding protein